MRRKLPIIKGEIIGVINKIDDSKCKRLLIYRYIDWLSWDTIAKNLVYSSSTVRRWHEKALSQILFQKKTRLNNYDKL